MPFQSSIRISTAWRRAVRQCTYVHSNASYYVQPVGFQQRAMEPSLEMRVRMRFIQGIPHTAVDVDLAPIEIRAELELSNKFM